MTLQQEGTRLVLEETQSDDTTTDTSRFGGDAVR